MTDDLIAKQILANTQRIALVGASPNPARDSHRVMAYLLGAGFSVIPVNPSVGEVLGQRALPRLEDCPGGIDTVVCFRRSEEIEVLAKAAIAIGAKALWMQLGVVNVRAAQCAQAAGLAVVMNRCIMIDHRRLDAG